MNDRLFKKFNDEKECGFSALGTDMVKNEII